MKKLLLCGCLLMASPVIAQGMPGGGGKHRGGGETSRANATERKASPGAPLTVDPIAAIQRELPSLKADLKLSAEQSALWDSFAASVRQVGNIIQTRARREAMARPRGDAPAAEPTDYPPAVTFIASLADEDVQRGDAMREMKGRVATLAESLTAEQRKMFDRRIAQSQREALGGGL
jgi:hypothetical protein